MVEGAPGGSIEGCGGGEDACGLELGLVNLNLIPLKGCDVVVDEVVGVEREILLAILKGITFAAPLGAARGLVVNLGEQFALSILRSGGTWLTLSCRTPEHSWLRVLEVASLTVVRVERTPESV